jgi:hypothetical protein
MSAAASPDRLSNLSDDLLTRILSFAPTREAASTTALSRRWRSPLWLNTATVNLDYRSYTTTAGGAILWRAMDDADHAFSFHRSHGSGPKKLTVLMRDDATTHAHIYCATRRRRTEDREEDAVGFGEEEEDSDVEAEEEEEDAGRVQEDEDSGSGIQELRLEWVDSGCPCTMVMHAISPRSFPFATLRVLDLTGCFLRSHSDRRRRVTFPFLEALRLRRCRAELAALQDMITAAPRLADIRLEAVLFLNSHHMYRLRCPAAIVIVMANCGVHLLDNIYHACCSVKLNAPRLRRFHYVQVVAYSSHGTSFSLESPTTLPLDHVHLALPAPAAHLRHSVLSAVCHTRVLRLTVFSFADLNDGHMPMLFTETGASRDPRALWVVYCGSRRGGDRRCGPAEQLPVPSRAPAQVYLEEAYSRN